MAETLIKNPIYISNDLLKIIEFGSNFLHMGCLGFTNLKIYFRNKKSGSNMVLHWENFILVSN